MFRKEAPKFTKDNYLAWENMMELYIRGMCQYWKHVETQYIVPQGTLTIDRLKVKQENTRAQESIVSILFDTKYIDVKRLKKIF